MKQVSSKELAELKAALNYLLTSELKELCQELNLPYISKKGEVIKQILHYLNTGKRLKPAAFPETSKANKGISYSLAPDTLILKGNYKNDAKTRLFMKKLVGSHFHFTAFGQDWIKERWLAGMPPTYGEFALFWQKEYGIRQKKPSAPKKNGLI